MRHLKRDYGIQRRNARLNKRSYLLKTLYWVKKCMATDATVTEFINRRLINFRYTFKVHHHAKKE